jgi:hypothetical protein
MLALIALKPAGVPVVALNMKWVAQPEVALLSPSLDLGARLGLLETIDRRLLSNLMRKKVVVVIQHDAATSHLGTAHPFDLA